MENELFNFTPSVKRRLNVLPSNPEKQENEVVQSGRFPSWLHRKLPKGNQLKLTGEILSKNRLHTVCEEARCPNLLECWSKKTATFLIMGKECTRNCGFCDIEFSKTPKPLEEDEPTRIAQSVQQLGLKHVVITMVARDDLEDGGSRHLVKVMEEIRRNIDNVTIEVLTSDFSENEHAISHVLNAKPEIFNHNIETVRSLTPRVRHKATYDRTLNVLRFASKYVDRAKIKIKSGIMVGLGEKEEEVFDTLKDLKEVGCDIVTIGHYLQPDSRKLRVKAFIPPEQFKKYEEFGLSIGIPYMYCGPFVRSSYNASEVLEKSTPQENQDGK